ncbi:MAG TPA: HPr(Ser) kinase/phosphatase [Pyrinomonadaceae bacterium]|nr:HPr(Ser) kinase/phosphatase [Pyrinomonadaceae bacterium]
MQPDPANGPRKITVAILVSNAPEELAIEVVAGANGLEKRFIVSDRIQKLGLALAGLTTNIHSGRVQIMGGGEMSYLSHMPAPERQSTLRGLDIDNICCVLFTKGLEPPGDIRALAEDNELPLLRTPLLSSRAITLVTDFLQEQLAPQMTIHGVLLDMYGVGVLLVGDSGIGKSECALDLIARGHRLVSDDSVLVKKLGSQIEGESPDLTREHLEIRGIGIVNVRDLFGVSSVGERIEVELVIELRKWDLAGDIDRLGINPLEAELFDIHIPKHILPVSPGRNLSVLVETAVRSFLHKREGADGVRSMLEAHAAKVRAN